MCALYIHRSNRLEALATLLVETMRRSPNPDPMIPEHVVIGNRGMREWLGRSIAEGLGIASNIDFEYPGRWFSRHFTLRGVQPAGADPWQPDALVWTVLAAFDALHLDQPGHEAPLDVLSDYLRRGGPPIVTRRRYQLARQIADLFDRYIVYRPDWVRRWSRGDLTDDDVARFGWQPRLFSTVQALVGEGRPHLCDRVARLASVDDVDSERAVHFFGLSGLPPVYVDALATLSRTLDAHLYLLSPTPFYRERRRPGDEVWSELVNPLLASFGAWTAGVEELLETRLHGGEHAPERHETQLYLSPLAEGSTRMLDVLQDGVLEQVGPAANPDDRPRVLAQDDSIQVHACYGALRQVEVLRDVLLDRLDRDPTLEPREIVVMTPDIERYAPLLLAVFDQGWREPVDGSWGRYGAPRLPIRIVDRSMRRVNPVADALLRLLALVGSRFEAPDVFDLLSLPPVAARLGLGEAELARVETWIGEAGARWGWDAQDRASFEQPALEAFTWQFALDRLALGAAMMDDGDAPLGLVPWEHLEGDDLALFGRFGSAIELLGMARSELREPRPLDAWARALVGDDESMGLLGALVDEEALAGWQGRQVREMLASLTGDLAGAEAQPDVEREALLAHLTGKMELPSPVPDDGPGSITVGSLVPARSVPFRVVVLLGMDDEDFPRRPRELGFDLMRDHRRAGDRDPRDEDRHLFLESILAARECWIALYTSRDERTNEPRFPSSPLAELLDVLDGTFATDQGPPSSQVLTHHPLHPTDPAHFVEDAPLRIFDTLRARAASSSTDTDAEVHFVEEPLSPAELAEEVPVESLARALSKPSAFFLEERLGIRRLAESTELPSREMVEPDGLDRWRMNQVAADVDEDLIELRLRGEGFVPPGTPGDFEIERTRGLARSLRSCFGEFAPAGVEPVPVRVRFGERWLTGTLPIVPETSTILMVMHGRPKAQRRLRLALHWMVARLAYPDRQWTAVGIFDDGHLAQPLVAFDGGVGGLLGGGAVAAWFRSCLEIHDRALQGPVPWAAETSFVLHSELDKAKGAGLEDAATSAKIGKKVAAKWFGGFRSPGEGDDEAVRRVLGDRAPYLDAEGAWDPDFVRWALALWSPIVLEAPEAA